jgi:hypothetical protein
MWLHLYDKIIMSNKPSHPIKCIYLHLHVDIHVSIFRDHPQYLLMIMKSVFVIKISNSVITLQFSFVVILSFCIQTYSPTHFLLFQHIYSDQYV